MTRSFVLRHLPTALVFAIIVVLTLTSSWHSASAAPTLQFPWPTGHKHRISGGWTYGCPIDPYGGTHNTTPEGPANPFGRAYNADYFGIDFQFGPAEDVASVADGTVIVRANHQDGYGNKIVLDHGGGYVSVYAHLDLNDPWAPGILAGLFVNQGALLGHAGNTGGPYPVHLHLHMQFNTDAHRPEPMSGESGFGHWGFSVETGFSVDEGCNDPTGTSPGINGASPYWYPDDDDDGYGDGDERRIGTDPLIRCGVSDTSGASEHWPSDLVEGLASRNKINVADLADFVSPLRRIGTKPFDPNFRFRNDLKPGLHAPDTTAWITVQDIAVMTTRSTGFPPMLGGLKALDGPACTD